MLELTKSGARQKNTHSDDVPGRWRASGGAAPAPPPAGCRRHRRRAAGSARGALRSGPGPAPPARAAASAPARSAAPIAPRLPTQRHVDPHSTSGMHSTPVTLMWQRSSAMPHPHVLWSGWLHCFHYCRERTAQFVCTAGRVAHVSLELQSYVVMKYGYPGHKSKFKSHKTEDPPAARNWSIIICAPFAKSPNCASHTVSTCPCAHQIQSLTFDCSSV